MREGERLRLVRVVAAIVAALSLLSPVTLSYPRGGDPSPATNGIDQTITDKSHSIGGYFTENAGQVSNEQVRFYSDGDMQAGFAESAVLVKLVERDHINPLHDFDDGMRELQVPREDIPSGRGVIVRITFPGSNKVMPEGVQEMSHRSNYFIGNGPAKWRTGVRSYEEIVYIGLYDGIDLSYRIQDGQLKYEFIFDPGADPALITVSYEGVGGLRLDSSGELVVSTALGELRDGKPIAYQDEKRVECVFVQRSPVTFGFRCEGRDPSRPLVIDPLVYSTFLGGDSYDTSDGIAVDSSGNAYATGTTYSPDFPVTPGSFDTTFNDGYDVFVTKLNAAGSALIYATFLGGGGYENGWDIAVDASGSAHITGRTGSTDFPTTQGSFDTTQNGNDDAFVAKLDAAGSGLVFATFLGGDLWEFGFGIALDSSGSAYVTGMTESADFPVTPGSLDTLHNGGRDAFAAKFNAAGSALVYATYLGGGGCDEGYSIAADSSGYAYVTGTTWSPDFPFTPGSFDTHFDGGSDGFVAKLDATGTAFVYATFLGGGYNEQGEDIITDSFGSAYVAGSTTSIDFPATPGSFDTSWNDRYDAYVAKLDAAGSNMVYATFLGGGGEDWGLSIAIDSSGRAYLTGATWSTDFPVTPDAFDKTFADQYDVFVAELDAAGGNLTYSTFLGGIGVDEGYGIAVDSYGSAYVTGEAASAEFPTTPGSFDTTYDVPPEAFVTKLGVGGGVNTPPEILSFTASPSPSIEGGSILLVVNATDADGDPLTYSFDFESDGVIDVSGPNNMASYTWGDDFVGNATVMVSDGTNRVEATTSITVLNVLPSGSASTTSAQHEGNTIQFSAHVTDPGSDDIFLAWNWGDGTPESTSMCYNDGVGSDPYPSPDIHARDITDTKSHTYGDNGAFVVTVFIRDDDSGTQGITLQITATPDNLPPTVDLAGDMSVDEGQPVTLTATATDPGSDDLTFSWAFELGPMIDNVYYNDGIGPDPSQSPGGTYPFTATDTATHVYGDDGVYTVTLTVTDDDGGSVTSSAQAVVMNLPPTITPFGPFEMNEADSLSVTANAVDPGSDDLTFTWTLEYGPTIQRIFYNDGVGPDSPKSPDGIFAFNATDTVSHTCGDNGVFNITLTVQDDDGGIATYETFVTAFNVAPVIGDVQVYVTANFTLRVAGEKWHDVCMDLMHNGNTESQACVVRYPGSPDDQSRTITGRIQLLGDFRIVLHYTPDDDPVNGQPNGANPAWVTIAFPDGLEVRLHHTFNVQHNDTWVWTIDDFGAYLVGQKITFNATASDIGSDDLTLTWDWGDGTPATATTYFNDGIGPDPYPSPGGTFPFTAKDTSVHAYTMAGTYTMTLRVTDDDGGVTEITLVIAIPA